MSVEAYDERARAIAEWTPDQLAAQLREHRDDAAAILRARWRYRLDEFAVVAMRDVLARTGEVSPPGDLDTVFFGPRPERARARKRTELRLVMTARGIGKSTRQRIRRFHGLLYGITPTAVTLCATDSEAVSWTDTIRSWCDAARTMEGTPLHLAFGGAKVEGNNHELRVTTMFGASTLLARGFTAAFRGLNVRGSRPTAVDLDDIESEERSITESSRDATEARIKAKILPLIPLQGGAEVWWVQTPVHHDCVAARALKGSPDLRAWEAYRLPVVRAWPHREDLWARCREIFFDVSSSGSREMAALDAERFYLANRAEMDNGADVLDSTRLPIFHAYVRRWSVGEAAFRREYLVDIGAIGGGILTPDAWPRFTFDAAGVVFRGDRYAWTTGHFTAHLDTSDGGDDGALVVVWTHAGRHYVVESRLWRGAQLSVQLREAPGVVAPWVARGLRRMTWEPPPGAASVVRDQLRDGLRAAGLRELELEDWPSTEEKNARILNHLEPLGAGGLIALPADTPASLLTQARDFNPATRANRDDWLDALQRAIARGTGGARPTAAQVKDAIRSVRWR